LVETDIVRHDGPQIRVTIIGIVLFAPGMAAHFLK